MGDRFLLSHGARADLLRLALEIARGQLDQCGERDVDWSLIRARTVWTFAATGFRYPDDPGEPGRLSSADLQLLRRHTEDVAGVAVQGLLAVHRIDPVGSYAELESMARQAAMRAGHAPIFPSDPWSMDGLDDVDDGLRDTPDNVFPFKRF